MHRVASLIFEFGRVTAEEVVCSEDYRKFGCVHRPLAILLLGHRSHTLVGNVYVQLCMAPSHGRGVMLEKFPLNR